MVYLLPLIETHAFQRCHNIKLMSNNENGASYQPTN